MEVHRSVGRQVTEGPFHKSRHDIRLFNQDAGQNQKVRATWFFTLTRPEGLF